MELGFFTMPIHPLEKDWRTSLKEDREAFLLADDHHSTTPEAGKTAHDRVVIGKRAVTMQFVEFIENFVDVVKGVRPERVTAELGYLPGGQLSEDALDPLPHFDLQAPDLLIEVHRIV